MNEVWSVTYWIDPTLRCQPLVRFFKKKDEALKFAMLLHPKFRMHLDCEQQ